MTATQPAWHRMNSSRAGTQADRRRVFEDLTVEENLVAATYALNGRGNAKPNFDLVYEFFPRLFERRRGLAGYLPGGEQRLLAIGRALIARPTLILLDEPSLGLAPLLSKTFSRSSPASIPEQGVSMLLVEQRFGRPGRRP